MSLLWLILLLPLCIILPSVVVEALPSGAAGCDCCGPAAQGFHTDFGPGSDSGRAGQRGKLSVFQTILVIDNVTMVPNTKTTFPGGVDLNWTVIALNETLPFRGILLRVQPTSAFAPFTLTGADNLWEAQACLSQTGNVAGITHRDRSQKPNATGTMRFDANGPVLVDLTIVYSNGRVAPGDTSVYGHDSFELAITGAPPIAPVAPVPVPVAPVPTPVDQCAINVCATQFFGFSGRLYNKFDNGRCQERCVLASALAPSFRGWRCGPCF